MNRRLPADDVTAGYIRPGINILRAAVEKIAAQLLEQAGRVEYLPTPASARSSVG